MKILFYPGSAGEISSKLQRLERLSGNNAELQELLKGAAKVLRRQAASFLSSTERAELGLHVISLMQLAESSRLYIPARCVLDVVVQLGETILLMSDGALCDDPSGLMPVGFGFGIFAAAVVAASRGAHQVVQLGLHVVAVAFKLAVELDRRTRRVADSTGSWTYMETSAGFPEVHEKLAEINHGVPIHRRGYVGIKGTRVMVCGPPSTLAELLINKGELGECHLHRLPGSMYASHLSPMDYASLQVPLEEEQRCKLRYKLISPYDGSLYAATDFHELVQQAIEDISAHAIDLDKVAKTVASAVEPSSNQISLIAVGSELATMADFEYLLSRYLDMTCTSGSLPDLKGRMECHKMVAIVGMSGRFPDCDNLGEFWALLNAGTALAREIPATRFVVDEQSDFPESRFGNFLKDPGAFDHRLFGISPAEAMQMDPNSNPALVSDGHVRDA